jgi:CRISPR associated protein Cas1
VGFARSDLDKIPEHWKSVGARRSALTVTSPRLATTAGQAVFNFVYALAEFACTICLRSVGLDPDLGWLHRDAPYRASAALDIQEAIRPVADEFVLELIRSRTFSRREFGELPSGQVRLSSTLAQSVARAALPVLESEVQPVVEDVVKTLAESGGVAIRHRTRRASMKRGAVQPRPIRQSRTPRRIATACQVCGLILEDERRAICDGCLPIYAAERSATLATAGKAVLAAMRASTDDPARSAEARAQLAESSRRSLLAIRAWEREYGKSFDREKYEGRVLPAIRELTIPDLMAVTKLSQSYCWRVRKGTKNLHPMHWDAVMRLAGEVQKPLMA